MSEFHINIYLQFSKGWPCWPCNIVNSIGSLISFVVSSHILATFSLSVKTFQPSAYTPSDRTGYNKL